MKTKRKINKVHVWAIIISVVLALAFIGVVAGLVFLGSMLKDRPELNVADFNQAESSVIYDAKGDEIANLGTVIRQNVDYEEIPNCVVDAFVAIEDSRYFEHNGFDIPRFTKALIEDILAGSFEQGGSTFTMQLVKNTYFVNDETGEQAARSGVGGVKRKAQEIALAMELEQNRSKQDIFESYVNKLNFGGDNNIRGIQKACQYYFGKDITEINLVEGALLAGVINAPNWYNPFYNTEAAQERLTEVLYQMKNHGYITQAEYELAKSIRVEDLLHDPYASDKEGEGVPYQAYVDAVISEVIDLTGLDPYTTTMHIYTYMNKGIQEQMDAIQAGNMPEDYLTFPDEYFECASVCIKNSTGEVVGILGGRNYAGGGQLLLNHATEQYKQPGSSIKPILDYALAFENLGWATDHVLCDRPMWLNSINQIPVYNDSGTYVGDVTLKDALGQSINTCAIQTLQAVLEEKKYEYVVNYAQSLGYDFTLEDFNIQYAIGGSTCEVTPYMHAAAYAAIMNYGVYNTPHTIERIEFTNGKSPITPVHESKQVISEAAAYLTTELMHSNVATYGGTYLYVRSSDYDVYGKTGTTDYGTSGKQFGIPSGAIKDGWLVAATSEYTTATWVGYEKAVAGQPSYITKDYYNNDRPQGHIAHLILEAAYQYGDRKPEKLVRPSSVTSITHIIGTWPYAAFTDGMDESLRTTGLIKSDAVKLVSLPEATIENLSSGYKVELGDHGDLTINWPRYPDETKLVAASDRKDISLRNSNGDVIIAAEGTCLFDYTKLYGPIKYMADITITGNESRTQHIAVGENKHSMILDLYPGDKVKVELYYGYEKGSVISNKAKVEKSVTLSFTVPDANSSYETVEAWASQYSFIEFKSEPVASGNYFEVFDSNGNKISYGTTIDATDPDVTYTCTYYYSVDHSLEINPRYASDETKDTLYLRADFDAFSNFLRWEFDSSGFPGVSFTENSSNLTIKLTDSSVNYNNITVKAVTCDKNDPESILEETFTFSIEDGMIVY